jgi:ADP-ribose pyrophosphatase YjhB (NUDIX family)
VAIAVLVMKESHVLLVRRINEPQRGCWTLPAGFLDAGEDPVEAAKRECLEETGLSVEITGLFDVLSGKEHARGSDILIVYRGDIKSGQLQPGDDADEAAFFSLHALPILAFKTTEFIFSRLTETANT